MREKLKAAETSSDRERNILLDEVRDLRARLDADGEERRKLTAILTDQRSIPMPAPAPAPAAPSHRAGGILSRLLGLTREAPAA